MATVKVDLGARSYEIIIESGILPRVGALIAGVLGGRTALVVTEAKIGKLYGREVLDSLRAAGFQAFAAEIPGGEESKTLETVAELYSRLLDVRIDRSGALITLGGGVTGDIGGFAAATYLRGIDYVQIPTTLLAQADASIGGKVGVDLPRGKNLVGAFYQPKKVIIDPDLLATLPYRELAGGLAEIIKHGIIADHELFDFIRSRTDAIRRLDRDALETVITRSCEIKAGVVSRDEKESGIRAILNLGHTIGHGIEAATGYARHTHGEAVSIGMVASAYISEAIGLAEPGISAEIAGALEPFGLPVAVDSTVDPEEVIRAIRYDKKFLHGKLSLVLPKRIGEVEICDNVTEPEIRQALSMREEKWQTG